MSRGRAFPHPLAARRPTVTPRHLGGHPAFVQEHQPVAGRADLLLPTTADGGLGFPTCLALARGATFFKPQAHLLQHPPEMLDTDRHAGALVQVPLELDQRQVWLLPEQGAQAGLHRRTDAAARPVPLLHPLHLTAAPTLAGNLPGIRSTHPKPRRPVHWCRSVDQKCNHGPTRIRFFGLLTR